MFNMYSILTFLKHKTSIYPHIIFTAFLLLVFHFTICARRFVEGDASENMNVRIMPGQAGNRMQR